MARLITEWEVLFTHVTDVHLELLEFIRLGQHQVRITQRNPDLTYNILHMIESDLQTYLPRAFNQFHWDRNWHNFVSSLFRDFWIVRCEACHHHPTPLLNKVGPSSSLTYSQIVQMVISIVRHG